MRNLSHGHFRNQRRQDFSVLVGRKIVRSLGALGIGMMGLGVGVIVSATAAQTSTSPGSAEPAVSVVVPTVELLDYTGRWVTGSLRSLDAKQWTLGQGGIDLKDDVVIATDSVAAFVVSRAASKTEDVGRKSATTSPAPIGSLSRSTPLSLGVLDSVDGQRLPGTFRVLNGQAVWDHRWIGAIPVKVDRIASLRMLADRAVVRRGDEDTVSLLNGDVVRGFVDSLTDDVVLSTTEDVDTLDTNVSGNANSEQPNTPPSGAEIEKDKSEASQLAGVAGKLRRIPIERVASIGFAELPVAEREGADVWTIDGSIVGASKLQFNGSSGWSFALASDWLASVRPAPTADNLAADPTAGVLDRARVLPLASCTLQRVSVPEGSFRYDVANIVRVGVPERFLLGSADVSIDGPAVAEFEIPIEYAGQAITAAFCGEISLVEPTPLDTKVVVLMEVAGEPEKSFTLDASVKRVSFAIAITSMKSRAIRIWVDDAGNGSIGDRVSIERGLILISGNARK